LPYFQAFSAALFQASSQAGIVAFLPLVFIFAIFYFILIVPQQKKQKKWREMLGSLKNGDKVVTSGGIRGTIISLKDDSVQLRVPPDNLRLEVSRGAVVELAKPEEAK
jgi:preprotein translocase subunit YajC